ncbi:MAG: hypothetical protein UT24_C0007G0008 [Candidatus Woesebacteria bacterium GW2011_GWB1_39_12]|uniref:EF-hand domain-containing protein n=2 Tax=Candidatus Woeseibacteriota TaxID=1752722 RepID=A0A0G0M231_9BACT|nr:MAG: hypothetical protein UT23_C0004G0087 [Candidatus Woesebacteria bacterium GW2011_GWA1_39_12]KKR01046.1 MAG: hypothetical protein UT24_C0007G0008 [Candidatus Woesebacteria bacterium GW2011_GWB1_39_12]
MAEDTTEGQQPATTTADATTDKSNLPDFEIPKGPITPEHQAFLINADLAKKDLEAKIATFPENGGSAKAGLERELQDLDHAGRYLEGKPHDAKSARNGLLYVWQRAYDRSKEAATIKDPDDAAAAANEKTLIQNILDKFDKDND